MTTTAVQSEPLLEVHPFQRRVLEVRSALVALDLFAAHQLKCAPVHGADVAGFGGTPYPLERLVGIAVDAFSLFECDGQKSRRFVARTSREVSLFSFNQCLSGLQPPIHPVSEETEKGISFPCADVLRPLMTRRVVVFVFAAARMRLEEARYSSLPGVKS